MVLLFGCLLLFGALFLTFAAFGSMSSHNQGVQRSLDMIESLGGASPELTAEIDQPFAERVLDPLLQRFQKLGRRISGADQEERIRAQLDRAGNPPGWTVDRVASGKMLGLFAFLGLATFLSFVSLDLSLPIAILVIVGATALGFYLPNIWLYNIATKRESDMQKAMADAIDLLTISVEAGLGFDAAVQQVAKNTEGPLADEFSRVLQEMQIGRGRGEALRALADRTSLQDLKSFVGAMVQADSFGIPIGQVLRVQSAEIRVKRRQRAEEKAAQVPVKIMVPVVLFILPCLFVVVLGPAAIDIVQTFKSR
ncbi:type II secretion system F family protein [Nocardioides guangzhouensis]|uniref:Type II secretion system F family protein n=1 Tax=Nocardioides guangzhouensis TaxID=2497878 RepID=A0A4V1XZ65_9ACTN|nr:type II secretion system F family protein [Nocardioides guangzhouensis]RYP85669.1 type II secretion system F family protein [Nocardioides guangzhouensis]